MNKLINKFWPVLFALVLAFIFNGSLSFAQENPDEIAKKYNVSFPIAELGNCESYAACRTYCEDPVNGETCVSFAKKKGFYKEEEQDSRKEELINKAKTELGCDSYESCQSLCQKSENFDKCNSFAKKYSLSGGHVNNPEERKVLEKAKEILGCDSPSSCMSFCEKEENRTKCSEFAKQTGLRGGEQRVGPGGCTSEETCKAFCSDPNNYSICSGFSKGVGGQFSGPGGCNSEESCRSYCREHPRECGYNDEDGRLNSPPPGNYNNQEMCNRTPSCRWDNNSCKCGIYDNPEEAKRRAEEHARFCRENPKKCGIDGQGGFENREEKERFEKFCRENPDKCGGGGPNNTIIRSCPAGQYWNGQSCIAGSYNGGSSPTNGSSSNYSGNMMSRDQQESGCRSGGGSCDWGNGVCNCRGYTSPGGTSGSTSTSTSGSSMSRDQQESGCRSCNGTCNWNGDMCQCQCGATSTQQTQTQTQTQTQPTQEQQQTQTQTQTQTETQPSGVQGVSIVSNIFQVILNFFIKD